MIEVKTYNSPAISESEILRYAGTDDIELFSKMSGILHEAESVLNYTVCFCKLNFTNHGDFCDFGSFCARSRSLSKCLYGASCAVVFLASIGHGIDRLIAKYSRISPSTAHFLHSFGTERVEALADVFCSEQEEISPCGITRRFSPGYGDLELSLQKDIFKLLSPERHVGVYLGEGLLMSPSKSVTAIFGIK